MEKLEKLFLSSLPLQNERNIVTDKYTLCYGFYIFIVYNL